MTTPRAETGRQDRAVLGSSDIDVVKALKDSVETARIPIVVVTALPLTADDRAKLTGSVMAIMEKGEFDRARFVTEIRRAMSGRTVVS